MNWNPFAKPVRPSQRATAIVRSPSDELLIASQERDINELRREVARTGLALTLVTEDRDKARAELKVYHDRRDKAKRNLRQFHAPTEPERMPPIN